MVSRLCRHVMPHSGTVVLTSCGVPGFMSTLAIERDVRNTLFVLLPPCTMRPTCLMSSTMREVDWTPEVSAPESEFRPRRV